jgi:hypothetical protein
VLKNLVYLSVAIGCGISARPAAGASDTWVTGIEAGTGLMQQPSSQYFLLGYSGTVLLTHAKLTAGVATTFLGRPAFESGNYAEQDYGGLIEFRKGVRVWKSVQLAAGLGVGEMRGYVKRTGENPLRSDYRMRGASTTIQLSWVPPKASGASLFLSHTLFSGFSTQTQSQARVAWPWSFAMFGAGFRT